MAIGKRKPTQNELFIPTVKLATGPGHPFYCKLNEVLAEAGFDEFVEKTCAPYYKEGGRPGIPPGVYFRMLFIGYFEGLDSQRGIAWRCADSLALRTFLGIAITEATPTHASMTIIRKRLGEGVFDKVFVFILALLEENGLLRGKAVGIDATTLEANAAMKSIVRRDNGKDWKGYLQDLAKAEGIESPTEEDLRRLDRNRPDKKVPNQEWKSPIDPDSRIAKMKDGRTHLAHKAEHAVALESEAIVATTVTFADKSDPQSAPDTLSLAEANLVLAGSQVKVEEGVADIQMADYGVPQSRRRLVLFAGRGFKIPFPKATHAKNPPPKSKLEKWLTLRDVIANQPKPITMSKARKNGGPKKHKWHVVRDLQPQVAARLNAAIPGKTWLASDESIRPKCHRDGYTGFTNVYGRMSWDQTPVTMTGGCTTACKGRFGHPNKGRTTISVREAALIQTFPRSYHFETDYMDAVCDMIGNAVPPRFARVAGRRIRKELEKRHESLAETR